MDSSQIYHWWNDFKNFDLGGLDNKKIILAPSTPYLAFTKKLVKNTPVLTSAQNVSQYQRGAHTGYVGAFQTKECCDYAIVGHSEREEPLELVLEKRKRCLENDITPIVCFTQPENAPKVYVEGALIAWEDPKNISKGGVYREKDPQEIINAYKVFSETLPNNVGVIYGGSVNKENIKELVHLENLQGVLVGNASLDPYHFKELVEAF